MQNFNLYATLKVVPTICTNPQHKNFYITRGASADLNFPIYNKVYTMSDIDQATFTLKQGRTLF
jgi:hypothetical protein